MRQTFAITRKELASYFSSPMAFIFVGVFLTAALFTFFNVDAFWARGLADVRPLFRWLPLLIIFLVSTLTMRQWSEEQQTGTLELLLTLPLRVIQLVIGKFLGVLALVALALLLTGFLPLTVSFLGRLDWGPVIGGYLAALLMASAYIAIGLFVSSRTDNQLVALIVTVILCGLLYLLGTPTVIDLVDQATLRELLRGISTSSRFESIERGVIDLRDLVYYGSLTGIFLALNVLSLSMRRWSQGSRTRAYRQATLLTSLLVILNLVVVNWVLYPIKIARADLTADREYSLSAVTRNLLDDLDEPLLIRGYFSEQNHPLLEPLIPKVQDILEEYQVAADSNLTVEFIDPIDDPEAEREANETYNIRPVQIPVTDRGGSSILNVYFDILIRYGDQSEVLNFGDLIEVDQFGDDYEVRLRNLEYDLSSSIKRVVYGFQNLDALLASLDEPASLTLYYTPETLPADLAEAPATVERVTADIATSAGGMFTYQAVDVSDPANGVNAELLREQYQIEPLAVSFFGTETFYFHLLLQVGDQATVIYPQGGYSEGEVRTLIESSMKRLSPGFLQVVGFWTPPATSLDQFGQQTASLQQYQAVQQEIAQNYETRTVDLTSGTVPSDVDILVVIGPQTMSENERYAVDQFLMRGGSVFVAAGSYQITVSQSGALGLVELSGGLGDILTHYGVTVEPALVVDLQNDPFPVPVERDAGGIIVQMIESVDYPPFVRVSGAGLEDDSPIIGDIPSITLNWASPLILDPTKNEGRTITNLLESSNQSWTSISLNTQPDYNLYPTTGFPTQGEAGIQLLGVAIEGSFTSFYADKASPLEQPPTEGEGPELAPSIPDEPAPTIPTVKQSPQSARLIVVGSSEFLNDNVLDLAASLGLRSNLDNIAFLQNSVDWFVEDTELATLRTRGTSARILDDLSASEQTEWEVLNYGLALVSVIGLGVVWFLRRRAEQPMPLVPLNPDVYPLPEA